MFLATLRPVSAFLTRLPYLPLCLLFPALLVAHPTFSSHAPCRLSCHSGVPAFVPVPGPHQALRAPGAPPPIPGLAPVVMSARFGLEHPVPGASSCCWPQPFLFSWCSEKCSGVGGVVGHGVGDELTMRRLLCISGSAECICFGWGWGGVVWKSKGLRREDSWVPDNGRCRLQF